MDLMLFLFLCGFVVFTIGVSCCVLPCTLFSFFLSVLFSIVITSPGEERELVSSSRALVCLFARVKSSWCLRLAATCACGTHWTFLFMFIIVNLYMVLYLQFLN